MRFGICGYGNLGKAVERKISSLSDATIVGIFSRRGGVVSELGSPVYMYESASAFEGEIDVMLMCGGSQEDLLWQSPQMLEHFDIVDTFDTHAKIQLHKTNLERVSEQFGHKAIYSCGWDPGLFSMARTLAGNIFDSDGVTFWGKGVSQGHSEALRNISGILDAVQFTVPNRDELKKAESDPTYKPDPSKMHDRDCFIALDGTRPANEIIMEIKNTENYFKGQNVSVFVRSAEEVAELKKKMFHQGEVIGGDGQSKMQLKVAMDRNPDFTAKIVVAYAYALPKLDRGVYSVLDIPLMALGSKENQKYL